MLELAERKAGLVGAAALAILGAEHNINAGPAPMNGDGALARTENTRRLVSEGWYGGYGDEPIIPHRFVGSETKFSKLPVWAQQNARTLWNAAMVPGGWSTRGCGSRAGR